jgi:hypothetical protein
LTNDDVLSIVQELPLYIALKLKRLESKKRNQPYNGNNSEIQKHQKRKVVKVKFSTARNKTNATTMSSKSLIRHEMDCDSNLANIKVST